MSGFEFKHQYEDGKPEIIVRLDKDANLDTMAEAFESFLKAVGYAPDIEVFIDTKKAKP